MGKAMIMSRIYILLFIFLTVQPIMLYPSSISIMINAPKSIAVLPGSFLESQDFFILVKTSENVMIEYGYSLDPENEYINVIFDESKRVSDEVKIPFKIFVDKNAPAGMYNLTIYATVKTSDSFFSLGASFSINLLVTSEKSYKLVVNVYNREGLRIETARVMLYYLYNGKSYFWMSSIGGKNVFYVVRGKYLLQCFIGSERIYNATIEVTGNKTVDIIVADILISNVYVVPPKECDSPLLFVLDISNKNPYIINKEVVVKIEIWKEDVLIASENVSKIVISGSRNLRIRGFVEVNKWSEGKYELVAFLLGKKGVIYSAKKSFEISFRKETIFGGLTITFLTAILTTILINTTLVFIGKIIKKPKVLEAMLITPESPILKVDFDEKKVKNLEMHELLRGNAMMAIQNLINAKSVYIGKDKYAIIEALKDFPDLRLIFFIRSKEYRPAEKLADELSLKINDILRDALEELKISRRDINAYIRELIKVMNRKFFKAG